MAMLNASYELHGVRILACAADGARLRSDRDAVDLISSAWAHRAKLVVIPIERLDDDFFRLRTRIAGEIVQKFVTYRMQVAIVGDISQHVSESSALRDFVSESNRGEHVWFVTTLEELDQRLQRQTGGNRIDGRGV
jgi:uncharacterized protein DUF4180